MTGKWFIQEVEHLLKKRNRLVILDPHGMCGFLLPLLDEAKYKLLSTDSSNQEKWQQVKEELFLRHQAETLFHDSPVVFYVTREQKRLSFLFDYCHTHGCLDLSNPAEWLKKKLFASTGLQVQMDNSLLMIAAKVGVDKDLSWWKKVVQKLIDVIDMDSVLQDFLHDPENYFARLDKDVRRLMEERLSNLLGQPYIAKQSSVLANELVKRMFEGLINNDIPPVFLNLYYRWTDSDHFRPSLLSYLANFKPDNGANPWAAHPDHCFEALDRCALKKLTSNLYDNSWVKEKLEKIKLRANSKRITRFTPDWWDDVITLLDFDISPLAQCDTLQKVIDFYTGKFGRVDGAIRNLYVSFINEKEIIRPLQEYYESLDHQLLQVWFNQFDHYKSNQQGRLVHVFRNAAPKTAVIVCDGLRYEVAVGVAESLEKTLKVEKRVLLASIPTETETGMSALFLEDEGIVKDTLQRQKKVNEASGRKITWMRLEELNYGVGSDFLGLMYGDIDYASEKLQMAAVKLFDTFTQVLAEKIDLLQKMGYHVIHVVTDHGFVLTGLLEEADKIEPNASGKKEVHERFIRTVEKQLNSEWIGFERPCGEFNHVYVAKNHRPFRTTGMYGYSHGGITPQETIIPHFVFQKPVVVSPGLKVMIDNIKELAEVTGDIFAVVLRSAKVEGNLFTAGRKVNLLLFAAGMEPFSSSQVFDLGPGQIRSVEFSFSGNQEVRVVLVDAQTKEQLDSVIVKKSNVRDTGGLI